MATPYFTLAVGTTSGPESLVTDFSSWTLDNNLDDGCTLTFDIRGNGTAAPYVDELASDCWLYRGPNIYQRFRIASVEQTWDEDGADTVSIQAICYRRLLQARHVPNDVTYTGVSQGTIVWNLISGTQAQSGGNLGITLGSAGPSVLRDRLYLRGTNIFDAITELTRIDGGIEWDIDENLALQVRQIAAAPYTFAAQPLILGVNARQMSRPSSADKFANVAFVSGNTQTTTTVVAATAGIGTDPRGRWETVASINTADDQTQLQNLADGLIRRYISPQSTWRINMDPERYFGDSEYQPGDYVKIVQPRSTVYAPGVAAPVVDAQVIARSVVLSESGEITVSISAVEV